MRRIEFGVLLAAGIAGALAIVPISAHVAAETESSAQWTPHLLEHLLTSALLTTIVVGLGLWLARSIGLGAPLLEAWLAGESIRGRVRAMAVPVLVAGVALAGFMFAVQFFMFRPLLSGPAPLHALFEPVPVWQRLLGLLGVINEELVFRLYLLSLVAWLLAKVWPAPGGRPTVPVLWVATAVSAIAFGLAHAELPAAVMPLTPLIVVRALVSPGVAGLAFGYLYWRHGLEAAVAAHLLVDVLLEPLVLLALTP